jgi:hypothetical protein
LIETLADNVSPHGCSDYLLISCIGFLEEKFIAGGFSGEGKGCEGVHDEVDPEHLD